MLVPGDKLNSSSCYTQCSVVGLAETLEVERKWDEILHAHSLVHLDRILKPTSIRRHLRVSLPKYIASDRQCGHLRHSVQRPNVHQ